VYHASKKSDNDMTIWRKLDHIAIFFMIAGTYTAVCGVYLPPVWFYPIVSAQWGIVLFGIFFKFFFLNAPRVAYTIIYLAMGWMALIPIKVLYTAMGSGQFALLLGGGLAFSVGAVFYALKKPVIVRNRFGFHEIFHVMIVIGASLHYVLVYRAFGIMRAAF
jgi:hemolysin III